MSKIYTKTGDKGQTSLVGGKRVSKSDIRLEAYGTADELNSFIGLLRSANLPQDIDDVLHIVQNKLFNIGAILATEEDKQQYVNDLIITETDIQLLESEMDRMDQDVPVYKGFILPVGSTSVAYCHVCRTITRRLERKIVELTKEDNRTIILVTQKYINRLSDYFFILAKKIAQIDKSKVFLWEK